MKTQSGWPHEETDPAAGQSGPEVPQAQGGGRSGVEGGSSLVWSHREEQKPRESGCF